MKNIFVLVATHYQILQCLYDFNIQMLFVLYFYHCTAIFILYYWKKCTIIHAGKDIYFAFKFTQTLNKTNPYNLTNIAYSIPTAVFSSPAY